MKYIQKGHVDDKLVSQLLQVHQTFFVTLQFLLGIIFLQLSPWTNQTIVFEEEIEGEAKEKNNLLEQTPVVLIGKYMDLLHLDDSNLWEPLENIRNILSCIVDMRNCDYVLEHTSLLEKIHNMMLLEDCHNLKQYLALLELFQSSSAMKTIANDPRLLESLINEVYNSTSHDIQQHDIDIVRLLCGLAYKITTVAMKMVTSQSYFIPKLFELLSARFSTDVDLTKLHDLKAENYFQELLNLVEILSRAASQIDDNMTRSAFASAPGILERLLLDTNVSLPTKEQKSIIKALTFIDSAKGNAFTINLTSPDLFDPRGKSNLILGLHKEALADFEAALNCCEHNAQKTHYMLRCMFCKVKLEDYNGALHDANDLVTNFQKSTFFLQERGVVKEMMGNYEGAIEDLTEALKCASGPDYECLKHRAYAHFKLGLVIEAHQDAEMANQLRVSDDVEDRESCVSDDVEGVMYLGFLPVPEFLGYKLT
jgi:tetratricopeptide (TPR) repeat protein